jgi:hypothetical protein
MADAGETSLSQANYSFGRPWPELNEGLSYTDTFRCAGQPPDPSLPPPLSFCYFL